MTGKSGDALGADLGSLWYAGKHDLPTMANDYRYAWDETPYSISGLTGRGGGLGVDPGGQLDAMCDRVNKFLLDSESVLDHVGQALVWVANHYAATDASCAAAYNKTKDYLEQNGGS